MKQHLKEIPVYCVYAWHELRHSPSHYEATKGKAPNAVHKALTNCFRDSWIVKFYNRRPLIEKFDDVLKLWWWRAAFHFWFVVDHSYPVQSFHFEKYLSTWSTPSFTRLYTVRGILKVFLKRSIPESRTHPSDIEIFYLVIKTYVSRSRTPAPGRPISLFAAWPGREPS